MKQSDFNNPTTISGAGDVSTKGKTDLSRSAKFEDRTNKKPDL